MLAKSQLTARTSYWHPTSHPSGNAHQDARRRGAAHRAGRRQRRAAGHLTGAESSFGVAAGLTGHALDVLGSLSACPVCGRRPLDAAAIFGPLAVLGIPFSVDFHLASASTFMPAAKPA